MNVTVRKKTNNIKFVHKMKQYKKEKLPDYKMCPVNFRYQNNTICTCNIVRVQLL